ncbi:Type IV pilus biogenesis protein PilP [hydrothermal vent metagenome]|uniref:Type IV pilus biogenesis protein PilP n=1 Tax=hydrothermal vent metagenome TaxID=652676 RepID=A0A3B0Z5W7_9ZZZZ
MLKRRFNIGENRIQPLSDGAERGLIQTCYIGLCLSAVVMLSACSSGGTSDLEGFVAKVKAGNPGRVEPLPELKLFEKYAYSAYLDEIKDPFITWETINPKVDRLKSASGGVNDGVFPDGERAREALESYPLETLTMMGTLEYSNENWGLIKAPDGIIYRVKSGNYMGQNHGKISKINSEDIALTEIVSDGLGGWENRPVELSLNED